MKKISLTIIAILLSVSSYSQMGVLGKKAAKQIELLKDRTMLVVSWEDEGFNANIKEAIEKVWTFSDDIKYISKEEWDTLAKDKDEREKYTNLYYTKKMLGGNAPDHSLVFGLLEKKVSTLFVFTPETGLADLMLSLKNMQLDLEIGNNYKQFMKDQRQEFMQYMKESLPTKTLYIDKDLATKKLLKKIDGTYPYPYKLVSHNEINDAILAKDPDVLFIRSFIKAQRPITKTRLAAGDSRVNDSDGVVTEVEKTSSMSIPLKLIYRASDLKMVGGTGAGDKIDIKDLEMLLMVMKM